MKLNYYIIVLFSLLVVVNSFGQDKLFLKDGKKINCKIISVNPTNIDYKDSASTLNVLTLEKKDVLMAELKVMFT